MKELPYFLAVGFTSMFVGMLLHKHLFSYSLNYKLNKIMATEQEVLADLAEVSTKLTKIGAETTITLQKVIDLEAIIAAEGNIPESIVTAVAELKVQAQAADDLVPDVTTPPVEEEEPLA